MNFDTVELNAGLILFGLGQKAAKYEGLAQTSQTDTEAVHWTAKAEGVKAAIRHIRELAGA